MKTSVVASEAQNSTADKPVTLRIASGVAPQNEGRLHVAAEIWLPDNVAPDARALICLPGGGMNRRFFDLMPADGDDSFSFARQMRARGFIVVLIDHLGIGESDRPADGYMLTPNLIAATNARATEHVLKLLRTGGFEGASALPGLKSIGVGHSMGAMMTVIQQAQYLQHSAIALLGFATRGLPEYVKPEVRELAADHARVREELIPLAREMFQQPYPRITRGPRGDDLYGSASAEAKAVAALKAALDVLLPVPCYMSMLPGNVAPEAASIDVPVFIGVGERDMTGPPGEIPAAFSASPRLSLHVLPEAGHSHFLFPSRAGLFGALAAWAQSI